MLRLLKSSRGFFYHTKKLSAYSVGIITAISPHLGYQKAADIAKKAIKTGESVRSLILKEKLMDEDELNRILDPIHMTEPGISGKDYLIKK